MTRTRTFALALVFLFGCAFGGAAAEFVVPPATAQQQAAGLQRWEAYCFDSLATFGTIDDDVQKANKLGAEGWELVAVMNRGPSPRYCFKRPVK